jgi:hypothetical protein
MADILAFNLVSLSSAHSSKLSVSDCWMTR